MNSPDDLQHDIEATRQRLGDTMDALGEKFDVTAQASRHRGTLLSAAAVGVTLLVAVVVIWRRRR